eukprot:9265974-Alexandrium_andersonii.AAC.1
MKPKGATTKIVAPKMPPKLKTFAEALQAVPLVGAAQEGRASQVKGEDEQGERDADMGSGEGQSPETELERLKSMRNDMASLAGLDAAKQEIEDRIKELERPKVPDQPADPKKLFDAAVRHARIAREAKQA